MGLAPMARLLMTRALVVEEKQNKKRNLEYRFRHNSISFRVQASQLVEHDLKQVTEFMLMICTQPQLQLCTIASSNGYDRIDLINSSML
jgi:hypothetical protein